MAASDLRSAGAPVTDPAGGRELVSGLHRDTRVHIVTGKGGTGKTTVAASLALALSEGGRRVLLVEVEGRQGLAQLFDVAQLGYDERKIATSRGRGEVVGLAVDPEDALLDYLDLFYNLRRSARVLKRTGAIDFATTLAPGVRDVLLTGKIKEAATRSVDGVPVFDAVVLDAPPTGRIRNFLDATNEVAKLTRFGPINRQSSGVIELLHGPRTAIHLVTLLEEMPVQETIDAAEDLTAAGYPIGTIVVNRARPQLVADGQIGADGTVDRAALARGLRAAGFGSEQADELAGPLGDQLVEWADRQRVEASNRIALDAITVHGAPVPRVELPDLSPPVELGELSDLAGCFLTGGA